MKTLIIFDLDGVITSEEAYWDCAGLTLHELLYSPRYWDVARAISYQPAATARESREISRATLPEWLLLSFKARALNSNWDTCYAAVCLHLIDLLSRVPNLPALLPLDPCNADWLARFRAQIAQADLARAGNSEQLHAAWRAQHPFELPVFQGATGLALFERLDAYASKMLGQPVAGVFSRSRPFWRFCQDIFQEWLLGDILYTKTHEHAPAQPDKPGCLFFEEPLLPAEQLRAAFEALQVRGYTLGVASGRVFQEASRPLEKAGLLDYFDPQHLGTYDVVTRAEKVLRAQENRTMLGKPHFFHFQAAVDWDKALQNVQQRTSEPPILPFIAVGDSTSDILSGHGAGGLTVAVLTGARSPEARELLLQSRPDFVIEDVTKLPALLDEIESLAAIQKLQFERREVAEKLLRLWFAHQMNLATESVRLTPRAVSLNSFNGFYRSDGQEYFFKTHVEEHGVLSEYYHAELLDQAGYNVVRPLRLLHEKERQMVIYPVINWPVMFDLMHALEIGQEVPAGTTAETLIEAERAECRHLLQIYADTFQPQQDSSAAPIHQLFWHRLVKRFEEFYADKTFPLPANSAPANISCAQLMHAHWIINGVEQTWTLDELVTRGRITLDPSLAATTVVGHGDAHFGNVFLEQSSAEAGNERSTRPGECGDHGDGGRLRLYVGEANEASSLAPVNDLSYKKDAPRYLYFDPAFAGQHSPLLDIVKPLFHNVFATWMYFPDEVALDLRLSVRRERGYVVVEHNYHLTPLRRAILQTKQEQLLRPLVAWLEERGALPENWQEVLRLALMCCPLLTVDLFDETKRPPQIGWLGLAQAVLLGNGGIAAWKEDEE